MEANTKVDSNKTKSVKKKNDNTKLIEFIKKYAMVIVLALVLIFFAITTGGKILLPNNISNIIAQNAYVFVLATGMLLCILLGGSIDLSVGSVVCFVGAVGAQLLVVFHVPVPVAIFLMFAVGIAIGATQAFWIAYVRIPPFIVTLAGMLIFRGASNIVLNGLTVSVADEKYEPFVKLFGGGADCYVPDFIGKIIGVTSINITCLVVGFLAVAVYLFFTIRTRVIRRSKGYEVEKIAGWLIKMILISAVIVAVTILLSLYKGIPSALLIVMIVVIVYTYITSSTTVGRHFYAAGGNEKATKLSGINTNRIFFLAYTNMGFLAALAGMITVARMTSAQPTYGQNYEMDAISSCFIGGAAAYGGIGTVPGAIIGAVLMGIINLGMLTMGVDQNMQKIVKGLVLMGAVIFDVVSKRGFKLIAKN